jgi:hypothetical protein
LASAKRLGFLDVGLGDNECTRQSAYRGPGSLEMFLPVAEVRSERDERKRAVSNS